MKIKNTDFYESDFIKTYSPNFNYLNINYIPENILNSAYFLLYNLLQPIRNKFGEYIIINSFIRSSELNIKIRGSENSQHKNGEAVDISVSEFWKNGKRKTKKEYQESLFKLLAICQTQNYRQLIFYPKNNFIHISINSKDRSFKKQFIIN